MNLYKSSFIMFENGSHLYLNMSEVKITKEKHNTGFMVKYNGYSLPVENIIEGYKIVINLIGCDKHVYMNLTSLKNIIVGLYNNFHLTNSIHSTQYLNISLEKSRFYGYNHIELTLFSASRKLEFYNV